MTCSTFFGLNAVTGLRISEALAFDTSDLDFATGVLSVRHGKLGKERLLPLYPTVVDRLIAYTTERNRLPNLSISPSRCSAKRTMWASTKPTV